MRKLLRDLNKQRLLGNVAFSSFLLDVSAKSVYTDRR